MAPTIKILSGVAIGIWCSGIAVYVAYIERYQYFFRHAEFVKEPVRVLKGYEHTEHLLGKNIKQLRFDLSDRFTRKNDDFATVVIPIVGSKTKGKMYSWSSRQVDNSRGDHWRVDRLDLMLHKHPPFTFYKHPAADYVGDSRLTEEELGRFF